MIIGKGDHRFRLVENWGLGPDGRPFGGVLPSVTTDSQDRVYITRRTPPAVLVYDRDGRYLTEWGEDIFHKPHSVWISDQDEVFITDTEDHTVRLLTTEGKLMRTWGTEGVPGATGKPFNRPTWAIRSPEGDIFITDGYGQHRVHHFSADGDLLHSWGSKGAEPGQFSLPHGVRVDPRGRVLALDRDPNHRLQIFDTNGTFIEQWTDLYGPNDICIDRDGIVYVAEGGSHCVSLWTLDGELLVRLGPKGDPFPHGLHSLWVDSHGDMYVTEVLMDSRLQKFECV
jgi:DNA-binding beta-propeller fold protein YncE